jgi:hypothetical protein
MVNEWVQADTVDAGWTDYVIEDGKAVKGARKFEINEQGAAALTAFKLTGEASSPELGVLRVGFHGPGMAKAFVNGVRGG